MKFFACVLDTAGHGIGEDLRRQVQSMALSRLLTYRWDTFAGAAVLTGWDEFGGEISVERHEDWIAVGQARLDNRTEMERRARAARSAYDDASDLALILRLVAHFGSTVIPTLIGDFGFVAWHAASRTAISASDAFNLVPLYYTQHLGLTLIGSRAEPLSMTNTYNVGFLGDLLTDAPARDHTVYSGVEPLPAASTLTVREGRITTSQYWSVSNVVAAPTSKGSERDAVEMCRDLLTTSIRLRLDPSGRTWSQLSGGIDSSAVVSVAQWLVEQGHTPHGLAGTLTFVLSSQTGSDERAFSDAVVKRWGVRNEVVVDAPLWFDDADEAGLPLSDQPLLTMVLAPIDCRFRTILREARARVLLTGWAGDHLFTGSAIYLADRLVRGQVSQVLGELAHRAALRRLSFWKLAYENVVKPFVPISVSRFARPTIAPLASWFRADTLRHVGSMVRRDPTSEGRIGHKYPHYQAATIADVQRGGESRALAEMVSVRHPFLYRPLVEFALGLPPELCSPPTAYKWILRESMSGILPEVIRTRVGKGGGGDSLARMFKYQGPFLKQLARDPILAELGLIDARGLAAAVDEALSPQQRKESVQGDVLKTLTIEAWLQVRSGRWPHGFAMSRAPVLPRHNTYQLTVTQRRSV
jgi:asparagine synthase (glutamine-hydrolysing)